MVKVKRLGKFSEQLRELSVESLELNKSIEKRILLFINNPSDTRLDNHPLTKRMNGKWAFSITDDIRIVYEWISRTTVRLREIGPHSRVYSRAKKQSPKR